jgi:predicted nucleic acid-binding protein
MILADTGFFIALGNNRDRDQKHHITRMVELMRRYANLPMDFADSSLVVLAEHLGHGRILTSDRRDFNIYRWNNTNPFENLLIA